MAFTCYIKHIDKRHSRQSRCSLNSMLLVIKCYLRHENRRPRSGLQFASGQAQKGQPFHQLTSCGSGRWHMRSATRARRPSARHSSSASAPRLHPYIPTARSYEQPARTWHYPKVSLQVSVGVPGTGLHHDPRGNTPILQWANLIATTCYDGASPETAEPFSCHSVS